MNEHNQQESAWSTMSEREREIERLTQNLHGVYLILINFVTDLTHIISSVLWLQVGHLQVVPVHEAQSFISGHHDTGRCQHICPATPQQNVFACKEKRRKKGKSVNSELFIFVFFQPAIAASVCAGQVKSESNCKRASARLDHVPG